jgi:hypothetical protein
MGNLLMWQSSPVPNLLHRRKAVIAGIVST